MANTRINFETALKRFVSATNQSKKYALLCANLSLAHFKEHGDVAYCQRFLDAMGTNYVRPVAYVKWLTTFAPIVLDGKKLVKDKSKDAKAMDAIDLDKAAETPFWDFAPNKEDVIFQSTDVIVAVQRVLKKFENNPHYKAKDDKATATVVSLQSALDKIGGTKEQQAANRAAA